MLFGGDLRRWWIGLCAAWLPAMASAEVFDVQATDVTTTSFSVVWVSDEPVDAAALRIFSDAAGTVEVTDELAIELASAAVSGALGAGLVKIDVRGLAPSQSVFVQTQTQSSSGTIFFPAAAPLPSVTTAQRVSREGPEGELLINDALLHEVQIAGRPEGAPGALVVFDVPGVGLSPISALVGEAGLDHAVLVDLNNLFDLGTGESAFVPDDQVLVVTEHRGLHCGGEFSRESQLHFRRVPQRRTLTSAQLSVAQLQRPAHCFFADLVCDDVVDIQDAQRVVNAFGDAAGGCGFNPDFDVVQDGVVDIQDIQRVFNRFGERAPFDP